MHDVIIIGGSYAGLAAALQLARARRRILVFDVGQRRNRASASAHGFVGQDGQAPGVIAERARAEVLAYPTVEWCEAAATEARAIDGGFAVRAAGQEYLARRIILAGGVVDELSPIPGLAERWGKTVFHCPYCHGYELDMGRLGVLAVGPLAIHFAVLVSEWGAAGQTTLFLNGAFEPDADQLAELVRRGIQLEREPLVAVEGDAPRCVARLRDGRSYTLDGLFAPTTTRLQGDFAEQLGCELETGPTGAFYKTDATKETTVPGVFACGDAAAPMGTVTFAVADGARAGIAAHQSLVFRQ